MVLNGDDERIKRGSEGIFLHGDMYINLHDPRGQVGTNLSTDPDGLDDLSEGQFGGEGVAVVDEGLSHSCHTESCRNKATHDEEVKPTESGLRV